MTAADVDRPSFLRRRRRWLRLACWTLFLLWFTRFAYVRVTTLPAAEAGALPSARDTADEFDQELSRLLASLTPPAPAPASAPSTRISAWSWWMPAALSEGLIGEWDLANSASQRAAMQWATGPAGARLDAIVALIDERRSAGEPLPPKSTAGGGFGLGPWRTNSGTAVAALVFRARYLAAEKSDTGAALRDLRAAFLLTVREQSAEAYSLPQYELGRLAVENTLPPEQAAEMTAFLRDELGLSITAGLERKLRASRDVDRMLDQYYTRDADGDGWLVLSSTSDVSLALSMTQAGERSRFWNVFSPLFHDRAAMRRRLTSLSESLAELDNLSYQAASDRIAASAGGANRLNVLDGPLARLAGGVGQDAVDLVYWQVSHRRAAVVMLALAAHRHETGEYPESLEALVPRLIDKLPLDAGANAPVLYERNSDSSYELKTPDTFWTDEILHYWWMPDELYPERGYTPSREATP